jgi:hypothetical protein
VSTFSLRFSDPATRDRLRAVAEQLGISMNRLAEEMIERELAALSLGLEAELEEAIRRLRRLRRTDVDHSLVEWAQNEGQVDPIAVRSRVIRDDPFGISAAFDR